MSTTPTTDTEDLPVAFPKVMEEEGRPSEEVANSAVFHRKNRAALVDKRSGEGTWAFDPTDPEAQRLLKAGLDALFPRKQSDDTLTIPDPREAVRFLNGAIRQCPDGKFERAWLNLGIALVILGKLDKAESVFRMLITRVEEIGDWQLTPEARSMVHQNLGQVQYLKASRSSDPDRKRHLLEEARREYQLADTLDNHRNSSRLLSWLVTEVDLGRTAESEATIQRIHDYVRQHGEQAHVMIQECQAKYPQLRSLPLLPTEDTKA